MLRDSDLYLKKTLKLSLKPGFQSRITNLGNAFKDR